MITGYLFWSIMIKNSGRPRWLELYLGRLFRIGPLYLFAIVVALIIIFSRTGGVLNVSVFELIKSLLRFGFLGILPMHDINGYIDSWIVLAGVLWTLKYEWYFYFSLVIIGQAARQKIAHLLLPGVALPILLFHISHKISPQTMVVDSGSICAALFCIGMICASLRASELPGNLPGWLSSICVIALVGSAFAFFDTLFTVLPIILLGLAFSFVVSGCDVFGLLSSIPARRLGNASFGIYLLQGLVLTLIFSMEPIKKFALSSSDQYWGVVFLSSAILIVFAAASHFFVEQPGIRLGQSTSRAIRAWMQRKTPEFARLV